MTFTPNTDKLQALVESGALDIPKQPKIEPLYCHNCGHLVITEECVICQ